MRKIYKVAVALLIIEFFFQFISVTRYIYFYYKERTEQAERWWWQTDERYGWFTEVNVEGFEAIYHPFLGWTTGPVDSPSVHVGEDGIRRTTGNPQNETAQTKKIFIFGGSTIWGHVAADNETIPSLIAQELNENVPMYHITNFGQLGYYTNQEVIYLVLLLKDGKIPDYVIFYDGCNDLYVSTKHESPSIVYNEFLIRDKLQNIWELDDTQKYGTSLLNPLLWVNAWPDISKYIKIYHYPRMIYQKLTGTLEKEEKHRFKEGDIDKLANNIARNYITNAAVINALSRAYGFKYLLIWQPQLLNKEMKTEEELGVAGSNFENYTKLYQETTERLHDSNIKNFYDLSEIFREHKETIFFDNCHINNEGKMAVTNDIVDILRRNNGL